MTTSKGRNKDKSSSSSEAPRKTVSLPNQQVIAKTLPKILEKLRTFMKGTDDETKHPVLIGSRAAAYWLPSFRQFEDWDIIATPTQTCKILEVLEASRSLTISLIRQPLDKNVVQRRPMTPEIEAKMETLPDCLYKVIGELKDVIKFEIEIIPVTEDGSLLETSSAAVLFDMCNNDEDPAYLDFPIGSTKFVVASLEVLETLKSSHINWPAYFAKHIADLHTLRALIPSTSPNVNMGVHADKKKPLTSPERTPALGDFLLIRTLEIEAFRGTPGAHINLNVSNEDFLGREDDLFVTRHIPHDDVHLLVKYGDIPIYDQLKTDSSKAMVSRKLFEEAPYDTQLKCVKEEAMVIALERFLLPKLASDPVSAYKSALIRICTTLTKGWFRQFAIDNFPRLAICDKDLITIRDEILKKHPLRAPKKDDPAVLLKQAITNLEELVIVQSLIPLTSSVKLSTVTNKVEKKRKSNPDGEQKEKEDTQDQYMSDKDSSDEDYYDTDIDTQENYWIIKPTSQKKSSVLISFINKSKFVDDGCLATYSFNATLSVQTLNANTDLSNLEAKLWKRKRERRCILPFHIISAYVFSRSTGGSWGGEDIWGEHKVKTHHVLPIILQSLGVEGLTEDLFVKYIMALVQPKLLASGETPLKTHIMNAKTKGEIPVKPQNHLWYDLWKYNGKTK